MLTKLKEFLTMRLYKINHIMMGRNIASYGTEFSQTELHRTELMISMTVYTYF